MSQPTSWLNISANSHFSLANLPFGIISTKERDPPRPAVAIGDYVLNLSIFALRGGFGDLVGSREFLSVFQEPNLNAFAALGRHRHRLVREYLQQVFTRGGPYPLVLEHNNALRAAALSVRGAGTTMHLPMDTRAYTDFYAGRNHAYNVGVLFRGPANALQPNYTHLPVGYAGRASSLVVSGTPIKRPNGQILLNPKATPQMPTFGPSRKLDYELELGAFLCKPNAMGTPVSIAEARDEAIFGFVLLNDWSARDIQAWEYVPLGPFNSKSFGSTISPWVVLADALESFRGQGMPNENQVELSSYLKEEDGARSAYDIKLEVKLATRTHEYPQKLTATTSLNLLWSFPQMVAHHTVGGCPMLVGDLLGSGTISGSQPGEEGSLLEQNRNGTIKIVVGDSGEERVWIEDGDTVIMSGYCGDPEKGGLVGFGECVGTIEPAPAIS